MLPVLATVTYLAVVIATWGFTSLVLDEDVVTDTDASILIGPSMAGAATVVVFFALRTLAVRRSPGWTAAAATAGVYGGMLLVAAIARSLGDGDPAEGLIFAARFATSPFVILPALWAAATVVAVWAATRQRGSGQHPNT
jgi:hypothetical protein